MRNSLPTSSEADQKPKTKNQKRAKGAWHVYILECQDGSFYTGITNNLDKRMKVQAQSKGSKYVKAKGFKKLLTSKQCKSKSDALKEEYKIKQLPKWEKLNYFNNLASLRS